MTKKQATRFQVTFVYRITEVIDDVEASDEAEAEELAKEQVQVPWNAEHIDTKVRVTRL